MISEYFQFETVGGTLAASAQWTNKSGSGATFQNALHAATDGIVLRVPTGGSQIAVRADETPDTPNQRAELTWRWPDTVPGTGRTGVVIRYRDASNYILVRGNQGSGSSEEVEVIERVGGSNTTLGTLPRVANTYGGAALRAEAIGSRLRVWYEMGPNGVQDRPPDAGYDLASSGDETDPGDWGVYLEGNAANDIEVAHFGAAGLPRAVMPPPTVRVAAASGYKFSPIQVTHSALSATYLTEIEALPTEPGDFPEGYRDLTDPATVNPHVIWVRTGYEYRVRARVFDDSGPGEWTPAVLAGPVGTATASGWGSKSWQAQNWPTQLYGDGTEVAPVTADFDWPEDLIPDYAMEGEDGTDVTVSTSTTGHERVTGRDPRPRRSFRLTFQHRLPAVYQQAIDFFDFMRAQDRAFNWTQPDTGEVYVMRFATDDYEVNYDDHGFNGGAAEGSEQPIASISFRVTESALNVAGTLTIQATVDPALIS